jgi:hypothetical protein
MNEYKEKPKNKFLEAAEQFNWDAHQIYWVKHSPHHWATNIHGYQLSYWPSTCKWMWNKPNDPTSKNGMPQDLADWIKARRTEG